MSPPGDAIDDCQRILRRLVRRCIFVSKSGEGVARFALPAGVKSLALHGCAAYLSQAAQPKFDRVATRQHTERPCTSRVPKYVPDQD